MHSFIQVFFFWSFLFSPQHQGRLSLDLSQQKRTNDFSESSSSRSSRASHGTNSLPSSARLGQSDTHAHTHAYTYTGAIHSLSLSLEIVSQYSCLCPPLCQVLPILRNTAQRGSKSLPLPAILAPCWGQTEVLLLHTTQVLKYLKPCGSNCKAAIILAVFKVFPDPQAWLYFVRFTEWQDQGFTLRFYSTGKREKGTNLGFVLRCGHHLDRLV